MAAVARIYGHYVEHGLATFEEVPPTAAEMRTRRAKALAIGAPYLVAEIDGAVVGYCYAAPTTRAPPIGIRSKTASMSRRALAGAASAARCWPN